MGMAAPEWLDPSHVTTPADNALADTGVADAGIGGAGVAGATKDPATTFTSTGHDDGSISTVQGPEGPTAGELFVTVSSPVLPAVAASAAARNP